MTATATEGLQEHQCQNSPAKQASLHLNSNVATCLTITEVAKHQLNIVGELSWQRLSSNLYQMHLFITDFVILWLIATAKHATGQSLMSSCARSMAAHSDEFL